MTVELKNSPQIPDCYYQNDPVLIRPDRPTPNHSLYLSNLDDQKFLRFTIKYLYLYEKAVCVENLKFSLSKILSDYYPLAGRLRTATSNEDEKLEIDCNGEGVVFAEAFLDYSALDFLEFCAKPNVSWRKLIYRVDAPTFLDVPPLVVQVTKLNCGGMIICTSFNHCICDGIGTSQFLNAWAQTTTNPNYVLQNAPFHSRHLLKPRSPPKVTFTHPGFTTSTHDLDQNDEFALIKYLQSQPLVATSITFNPSQILALKRNIIPSVKCTTFEALASHTWKSWVKSLNLSHLLKVKLIFSVNIRKRVKPELPQGYYGNGFVLGCAETTVKELSTKNVSHGVKLVQHAKSSLHDDNIKSMIDLLEGKKVKTDLSTTLVISQWSKLDLEHLDFGSGLPVHMGPLTSDVYCLFLPIVGDPESIRVSVSLPCSMAEKFEFYMTQNMDMGNDLGSNCYYG
ncbi:alcohol acyltransferase 9 [Silene latifolia]|uniref:alcohol acyltransferase 9 n=1 Tax=Silene latifolia TaxID=37657 RepID=UPI003D788174